ncbi:MAG: HAMP domain-containing sensor histidine kinase [Planctomycetota bacterium]|nr:HAMP domain-containing sensor histidine kinase [Planctomycetota bacterium]MDA1161538.1 HAMP domain-containing sensor histidine kinase [Planctomycetota bacterium]
MRRPIRIQILVPFSATIIAAVAIIAMTSAWLAVRQAEEQTLLRIQNVVDTLSDSRLTYTDAILSKMSGLSGADFLALDRDDEPVAATVPNPRLIANAAKAAPMITSESSITQLPRVSTASGPCFAARVAADGGGEVATLVVLYPEASWEAARWTATWPPIVIGAGTVVVMAGISFWLAERISRRINDVRALLGEIALGRFPETPNSLNSHERGDEIDDLVKSAGSLSIQLRELQYTIQQTERVRLLAQLAGGLAHQLRNAVTGARMAVQLHQTRCPLNSSVVGDLDNADSDDTLNVALRQLSLTEEQIRGLLSLSRQEVEPVHAASVAELIREIERLIVVQCDHFHVRLLVDLPADQDSRIADAEGFRTAVLNLSLNAIEAAGHGGRIEIVVLRPENDTALGVADCGERVVIEVRDSGVGPPADISDSLFEPFVTSKPEGVGLGLALASRAAEAANGTLFWERCDGMTVFRFDIPVESAVAADDERSLSPESRPRES